MQATPPDTEDANPCTCVENALEMFLINVRNHTTLRHYASACMRSPLFPGPRPSSVGPSSFPGPLHSVVTPGKGEPALQQWQ